jgi:hypothetical protein
MPYHNDLQDQLEQLVMDAITFAISAKKTTDFQFPFLLTETASSKEQTVMVVEGTDDNVGAGVEEARRQVRDEAAGFLRYVIAYDGILFSTEDKELLAFIFEAGQNDQDFSFVFYQWYKWSKEDNDLVLIVDQGFLRKEPKILGNRM